MYLTRTGTELLNTMKQYCRMDSSDMLVYLNSTCKNMFFMFFFLANQACFSNYIGQMAWKQRQKNNKKVKMKAVR